MLSFFKRKDSPAPAHAVDEAASVQQARTRARRRLVGAAVLVGIGIVGFPLLFETQPRPVAVDVPIVVPSRDPMIAPTPPQARSTPAPSPSPSPSPSPAIQASAPVLAEAVASAPAAAVAAAPARPAPVASAPAPGPSADAQRAQALLEGKPVAVATAAATSEPKPARFVVQAGAYTDGAALREARQKVEKLGLKTYTQVIETDAGPRTRVRVGPFETREDAEKAAARIKGSGLAAAILSL